MLLEKACCSVDSVVLDFPWDGVDSIVVELWSLIVELAVVASTV